MKKRIFSFVKKYRLFILLSLIVLTVGIIIVLPTYTQTLSASTWDGTVATSFHSGNGTSASPYEINTGSELAYFKSVYTTTDYFNKFYILSNNINLNNLEFSNNTDNLSVFSGNFNGQGYAIFNYVINNGSNDTVNNQINYGFFSNLNSANINNLNLFNGTINVPTTTNFKNVGILSASFANTIINNVSVYKMTFNITDTTNTYGGFIAKDLGGNTISNLNIDLSSNLTTNVGSLFGNGNTANVTRVLVQNNGLSVYGDNTTINTDNIFPYTKDVSNNITFTAGYSLDSMLNLLNNNSTYTWQITDYAIGFLKTTNDTNPANSTIIAHDSGISGTTVYVNDLDADLNYYHGLNYTSNNGTTLPTEVDKNIYNDTNLVKVEMHYNGTDIDNTKTGYVSLSEQQNTYVYYKYYDINNNGTANDTSDDYINVELIDNPFTDRPDDLAFNGWITDFTGAKTTFDGDYYTRYVKVPITYNGTTPSDIIINMYASWVTANKAEMTGSWSTAFTDLDNAGMKRYILNDTITYAPYDMTGYYKQVTIDYYNSCSGYYDEYGNYQNYCYCWDDTCTYYSRINNENYDSNSTYFQLTNGYMTQVDPASLNIQILSQTPNPLKNNSIAGFYRKVKIVQNASYAGYYDTDGNYLSSGTCYTSGGCSYYELIQYKNSSGNIEKYNDNDEYYYLVTRDTNIIVLRTQTSSAWSQSKPFTLTSVWNGTDYRSSSYINTRNISIKCYADTNIENIEFYNTSSLQSSDSINPARGTNNSQYFYGNWHNVKIGRGITSYSTRMNFYGFIGGGNDGTGSSGNPTKYKLIVESGYYNVGSLTDGSVGDSYDVYTIAKGIFGDDYDRVNNTNTTLIIQSCLAANWGGDIYSDTTNVTPYSDMLYKSGSFGNGRNSNVVGIYVGGRQGGVSYAPRKATIEGGSFYVINGGPISDSSLEGKNDMFLYFKGGEGAFIFGGAGRSATYGNRIVQMTGGLIDYSLFGGSNSSGGSGSDGTVNGTSYVYVGGNAVIGLDSYVTGNNTLWNAEAGSIFGNGDGKSGSSTLGSNDNAVIILAGDATVKRNIYGGGNFGATGVSSTSNQTYTHINIDGGTVNGSVYGGGNNNGSGSSSKTSTIVITMNDGTVKGSIYGGSRTLGTIYGSTNVNILNGTVATDVYGGGEGGYTSNSAPGTFVSTNTNVTIGNASAGPNIAGDVYGGSAYGTVNATSTTAASNSNQVNVTLNKGTVTGSIYGGAKGSTTFTPYIKGNIVVNINDGTCTNVFGGCNAAGIPEGTDNIYLNGGVVGSVYGGGNNAGINESNVYLQGSTVTTIYGGSNQSGIATITNITTKSGQVNDILWW
jgi:hypothetical protein